MKLSHLLTVSGAALASYLLITNHKKVIRKPADTIDLLKHSQASYQHIQQQLSTLQSYQKPLQKMTEEVQYKFQTYRQSIAGNLKEIQKITDKYTQK